MVEKIDTTHLEKVGYEEECELLKVLDHPHIAKLYHIASAPETDYLAFESCPGGDLIEML